MGEKLEKIYRNLQNLQLQPTRNNVMLLADCMIQIEKLNEEILAAKQGEDAAGEPEKEEAEG